MLELKQEGIGDIGFIDPNTVHGHGLKEFPVDTEKALDAFLTALNTKSSILFPYNFE
jgi:hypothetical protein